MSNLSLEEEQVNGLTGMISRIGIPEDNMNKVKAFLAAAYSIGLETYAKLYETAFMECEPGDDPENGTSFLNTKFASIQMTDEVDAYVYGGVVEGEVPTQLEASLTKQNLSEEYMSKLRGLGGAAFLDGLHFAKKSQRDVLVVIGRSSEVVEKEAADVPIGYDSERMQELLEKFSG